MPNQTRLRLQGPLAVVAAFVGGLVVCALMFNSIAMSPRTLGSLNSLHDAKPKNNLVPCPIEFGPMKGKKVMCVDPEQYKVDPSLACVSQYGTVVPRYVWDWGKKKVDWANKQVHHLRAADASKEFENTMAFDKLSDVTNNDWGWKFAKCPSNLHVNEDYFERAAAAYAVLEAKERFTMFEIGAGWGRWIIDAFNMAKLNRPDLAVSITGIETDPVTHEFGRAAMAANSITHQGVWLHGAIGHANGEISFKRYQDQTYVYGAAVGSGEGSIHIPLNSLRTMIAAHWLVDYIDIDCNGCEASLFSETQTTDMITERVKYLFVETHDKNAHDIVEAFFRKDNWKCFFDTGFCPYKNPCAFDTELGKVEMQNGDMMGNFWCANPNIDNM